MQLGYATRKLERLCTSSKELAKTFGAEVGRAVGVTIFALENFTSLETVPTDRPFRRHLLEGRRKGQWSVAVKNGVCICLAPDHDPVPKRDDGGVDLQSVTRVTVTYVGDYH